MLFNSERATVADIYVTAELSFDYLDSVFYLNSNVVRIFNERIVLERLQKGENVLLILPHHTHDDLRALLKDTLFLENSKRIHYIGSKTEWNYFWDFKFGAFFKNAIKVYVSDFASVLMNQNVIAVPVS